MTFRLAAITLTILAAAAFLSAGTCMGQTDQGAAQMSLYGGSSGPVPFPHGQHQAVLKDCNLCHEVFDQKAGIIERLKAEKKLKKKQVMNKQCIKCHRQKKKAGLKTGPTSCKKCHIKS